MAKGASDSKNARCRLGPPPESEDNKERHSGLWDFLPSFLSSLCPAKGQVTPSGAEGSEISSRRRLAKSLIRVSSPLGVPGSEGNLRVALCTSPWQRAQSKPNPLSLFISKAVPIRVCLTLGSRAGCRRWGSRFPQGSHRLAPSKSPLRQGRWAGSGASRRAQLRNPGGGATASLF